MHASGVKIGLEDPSDQVPRQGHPVGVLEQLAQGVDKGGPHHLGCAHPIEDERSALGYLEGLGQQHCEVVDADALLP